MVVAVWLCGGAVVWWCAGCALRVLSFGCVRLRLEVALTVRNKGLSGPKSSSLIVAGCEGLSGPKSSSLIATCAAVFALWLTASIAWEPPLGVFVAVRATECFVRLVVCVLFGCGCAFVVWVWL